MANLELQRHTGEFPRQYVPQDTDVGQWDNLRGCFEELNARDISTRDKLEKWLQDLSEFQAVIAEEGAARYIRMTCNTDDPELEKEYLHFVENIVPKTEPEFFELNKKYLASPARTELPRDRYFVYDRARQKDVDIFRQQNVDLQTQDEVLAQQYQKAYGAMTVEFDGSEKTLPQLAKYYEETDREKRRAAWRAAVTRQLKEREAMESILDQMISLRHQMAHNAGFENYVQYQFMRYSRFDYTPADCKDFHQAVEETVMPLRRQLRERRRQKLALEKLAPYDLEVDTDGLPPLRPFQNAAELIEGTGKVFQDVSPAFLAEFNILRDRDLLDLESRKGKAPGGYQSTLDEARLPFIFMNATGRNQDVFTLLHEGGHAFHALACRDEGLYAYRNPPIEFCEVASMGMEMMACERLHTLYSPEDAARARRKHLEDPIILIPWVAWVDAFQHWLYENPNHTRLEREQKWMELERRFGDDLDYFELEEWRHCSWYNKLHIFCVPLYYIEYAIAQLGALQLWVRYLEDPDRAVADYRAALSLGNSRPLPELFAAAGLKFAFKSDTIAPLMQKLSAALTETK